MWFWCRKQPSCPKCGSKEIDLKIVYVNVTATVPIRGGKVRYDDLRYDGERTRSFVCRSCGNEIGVEGFAGLTRSIGV